MTVRSDACLSMDEALDWAVNHLHPSRTASLDARVLLEHVTGFSRGRVFAHGDDALTQNEVENYRDLVIRRAGGEPVAYLRGWVEWYGAPYIVDSHVFVPRPETELVYECAADLFRAIGGARAADVGTGSGVIAIQLAVASPQAHIDAIDISGDALRIAQRNIDKAGVAGRVALLQGNLLEPLSEEPDLIVANLPYLSRKMVDDLPRDVTFEPALALYGGHDGLELYRELLAQLRDRGWTVPIVAEIDPGQAEAAVPLFSKARPSMEVEVRPDYARRDRIVIVRPHSVSS